MENHLPAHVTGLLTRCHVPHSLKNQKGLPQATEVPCALLRYSQRVAELPAVPSSIPSSISEGVRAAGCHLKRPWAVSEHKTALFVISSCFSQSSKRCSLCHLPGSEALRKLSLMLASLLIKSCQQAELHHQPGRGSVGDIVFQLKVTQKPLHLLLKGIGIISKCKCAIAAPRRNYWEVVSPVSTAEARKWGSCPTRALSVQFGSTSKGAEGSAIPHRSLQVCCVPPGFSCVAEHALSTSLPGSHRRHQPPWRVERVLPWVAAGGLCRLTCI